MLWLDNHSRLYVCSAICLSLGNVHLWVSNCTSICYSCLSLWNDFYRHLCPKCTDAHVYFRLCTLKLVLSWHSWHVWPPHSLIKRKKKSTLADLESWSVRTMPLVIPKRHFTTVPQSKPYLLAWQDTTTVNAPVQTDCEYVLKRDAEGNCDTKVNQPSPAKCGLLILLHFPAWEQVSLGPRNPCYQASSTWRDTPHLAWQRWKELL